MEIMRTGEDLQGLRKIIDFYTAHWPFYFIDSFLLYLLPGFSSSGEACYGYRQVAAYYGENRTI